MSPSRALHENESSGCPCHIHWMGRATLIFPNSFRPTAEFRSGLPWPSGPRAPRAARSSWSEIGVRDGIGDGIGGVGWGGVFGRGQARKLGERAPDGTKKAKSGPARRRARTWRGAWKPVSRAARRRTHPEATRAFRSRRSPALQGRERLSRLRSPKRFLTGSSFGVGEVPPCWFSKELLVLADSRFGCLEG